MRAPTLIVIVHFGPAELLDTCLSTIEAAERSNTHVVVVNNGAGAEPTKCFGSESWLTTVALEQGVGFGEANNIGVARGYELAPDWQRVFFLNNDTRIAPDALLELHRSLDRSPDCGIAGPLLVIDGAVEFANSYGLNVTWTGEAWDEGIGRPLQPEAGEREVLAVTGAALMVRRSVFEQIGQWPTHYGFYFEDLDLCLRARSFGWRVLHAPRARVAHRVSASSDQVEDFKVVLSWANRWVLIASVWPALALARVVPWAVARDLAIWCKRLRMRAFHDAKLQARSWILASLRMPAALWKRRRLGWQGGWTKFLVRPGSTPPIELPPVGAIHKEDPI